MDPNGEDFCEYGTHRQCLGAIWKNGTLIALPNLTGGNNANAFALNDQGQVAGFAENGTPDGTCATPFQVRRFEAVIWGRDDNIRGLPPLKGDTVGFAFGINDIGQVIGASGLCANTTIPPNPSGAHAVLWENGTPTDLGNLGGTSTVASSINNRGQVVGGAQSAADGTTHAFLWSRNTGMLDLGAFPGAIATVAPCCNTINDRGTVVGFAIDGTDFSSRALIWVDKKMMDLNTLITANSGWYLQGALSINDAGEITGYGTIGGEVHAFLARPK
jgi:probable HAF family extracellular repeat protein